MADRSSEDPLTPAEERLLSLLVLLSGVEARSDPTLVRRVMESARWQRAVREVFAAVGSLASAVVDGLAALVGWSHGAPRRLP
jgi:hypothetical protein